jgi:hypothetical protein
MSNVLKPGLAQIRRGITSHHGDGHLEAADWRTAGGIGQVAHAVFRHLDSVEEAEDLVAALNDSLLLPKISSELAQMRQWATVPPRWSISCGLLADNSYDRSGHTRHASRRSYFSINS